MTPYQISSEIYGGFYYPGITLSSDDDDGEDDAGEDDA